MLRRCLPLLALTLGCQAIPVSGPGVVEERVATATPVWAPREAIPCAAATPDATPAGPLDLPALWALALANNPTLREAAADVEAARGRWIQAGKYPNPHFLYDQDTIGSRIARQGNIVIQVNQEIVTAGKRHLDQAVARQETTAAA
ncbi:MAG TPA: TolC family protein, partial [Gemmataceae bacterium]|nr:TolC family protein [Gemmataceae bacterium]